jgi:hypothetical protein
VNVCVYRRVIVQAGRRDLGTMMCWRVRPSQSSFDALRDEGPLEQPLTVGAFEQELMPSPRIQQPRQPGTQSEGKQDAQHVVGERDGARQRIRLVPTFQYDHPQAALCQQQRCDLSDRARSDDEDVAVVGDRPEEPRGGSSSHRVQAQLGAQSLVRQHRRVVLGSVTQVHDAVPVVGVSSVGRKPVTVVSNATITSSWCMCQLLPGMSRPTRTVRTLRARRYFAASSTSSNVPTCQRAGHPDPAGRRRSRRRRRGQRW